MTLPTQNPIPSSTKNDQLFNAEKIDQVVNSDDLQYTDRFGKKRYTFAGLYNFIQTWISGISGPTGAGNIGYNTSDVGTQLDNFNYDFANKVVDSVAVLRNLTAGKLVRRTLVKNSAGYANGGEFVADPLDTTTADDGVFTIISKDNIRFKRSLPASGRYQIDWWYDPTTDSADYSLVINKAANFVKTSNSDDTALLPTYQTGLTMVGSGGIKKCLTGAVIFAYLNDWDFNGTILDYTGTTLTGIDYFRVRTARCSTVSNLTIRGLTSKDQVSNNTGFAMGSFAPNVYGVPCASVEINNLLVENASNAIRLGSNVYIVKFSNSYFTGYLKGITCDASPVNSGENMSFDHCVFANGAMPIFLTTFSLNFLHCSFDYNGWGTEAAMLAWKDNGYFNINGNMNFDRCHFEWGNQFSRWQGPVFKGIGTVSIKDSVIHIADIQNIDSGMTYPRNIHTYFYQSTDANLKTSFLILQDVNVANSCWDTSNGAWTNGFRCDMDGMVISRFQGMYRNFWKTPYTDFTNYVNSHLPSLLPNSTYQNTAAAAIAAYPASSKLTMTGDSNATISYDSTNNAIIVSTTTNTTSNVVTLDWYVRAVPYAFPLWSTSIIGDSANTTVAGDLANVNLAGSVMGGFLASNGTFTATQRLTWTPTAAGIATAKSLRTAYITGTDDYLPCSDANIEYIRLRITLTNFYATTAGNKITAKITPPRLEFVKVGFSDSLRRTA
ncbi:hypothetical protein [Stenotrophomonas phage BUCTxx100]|nr:hypothetical protein [Stenotrophomonas phage BUCTxx100]